MRLTKIAARRYGLMDSLRMRYVLIEKPRQGIYWLVIERGPQSDKIVANSRTFAQARKYARLHLEGNRDQIPYRCTGW